ncbi:MAG: hypothetical protein ACYDB7_02340, partial [Mycobacteriales bacterium]
MFALGRVYATVGVPPIYVSDVAMVFGVMLLLKEWFVHLARADILFRLLTLVIAGFSAHAVYAGLTAGYPVALKGLVLVVYPLVGLGFAAWISDHEEAVKVFIRWVLPAAGVGVVLLLLLGLRADIISAASGLYLAIAASFAVVPGMPGRKILAATTVVGTVLLLGVFSKRGPALAIILGSLASLLAARSWHTNRARAVLLLSSALTGGIALLVLLVNLSSGSLG